MADDSVDEQFLEVGEPETPNDWEFRGAAPAVADVVKLLASLPDVWGVRTVDFVEYIQPLSQKKNVAPPESREKRYETVWHLYMSVAGRIAMVTQAAIKNGWTVDFEPEPLVPMGNAAGYVQFDENRIVYREHVMITGPDGVRLGRKPGTAWVPAQGGSGAVESNRFEKCLVPGTRVLTTELEWVPIESLAPGDMVIGFDEQLGGRGKGHGTCLRPSEVLNVGRLTKPLVRLTTDWGEVISSSDHQWVECSRKGFRRWREASLIRPGDVLAGYVRPWDPDYTREAGYLAGFLDGEGTLRNTGQVAWTQLPGEVFDEVTMLWKWLGFETNSGWQRTKGRWEGHDVMVGWLVGGQREALRALGVIRPLRLLSRSNILWEGRRTYGTLGANSVEVLDVEHLPEDEVISVTTSTKTFMAEGLLSHNCETSARGRALAAWGFGVLPGSGVASLEEMRDVHMFQQAERGAGARRQPKVPQQTRDDMESELRQIMAEYEQVTGLEGHIVDDKVIKFCQRTFNKTVERGADPDGEMGPFDFGPLKPGEVALLRNAMKAQLDKHKLERQEV